MRRVPCMFLSTEAVHDSPSNSGTCQKSNLVLGCVISKCQEKKCETQEKKCWELKKEGKKDTIKNLKLYQTLLFILINLSSYST